MSRARQQSTVHVVADDVDQAVENLTADWSRQLHDTWLTPTTSIGHDPRHHPHTISADAQRARLEAELERTHALAPPDVTADLATTHATLADLLARREHLSVASGPYQDTEIGRVVRDLHDIDHDLAAARTHRAEARPWQRHRLDRAIDRLENYQAARIADWDRLGRPEAARLDRAIDTIERRQGELEQDRRFNEQWHRNHPEQAQRVSQLEQAVDALDRHDWLADLQLPEPDPGPSLAAGLIDAIDNPDAAARLVTHLDHLVAEPRPDLGIPPPDAGDGLWPVATTYSRRLMTPLAINLRTPAAGGQYGRSMDDGLRVTAQADPRSINTNVSDQAVLMHLAAGWRTPQNMPIAVERLWRRAVAGFGTGAFAYENLTEAVRVGFEAVSEALRAHIADLIGENSKLTFGRLIRRAQENGRLTVQQYSWLSEYALHFRNKLTHADGEEPVVLTPAMAAQMLDGMAKFLTDLLQPVAGVESSAGEVSRQADE